MKLALLKYDAGNIRSVVNALRRLGAEPLLTATPEELRRADKIIFPGQGEAGTTMAALRRAGLDKLVPTLRQPVLGICVGMQLLCAHSEEADTDCLGLFPVGVKRFRPQTAADKIPHMGWNTLADLRTPLFEGIGAGDFVYYIHSYYAPLSPHTIATTEYCGTRFSAALGRDNFYAMQFHPEKSGSVGERILQNFLDL